MRIAVTGATGNVGTAVVRRLVAEDHEVVGLARRIPTTGVHADRVEWRSVDLSTDCVEELEGSLRGCDAVVHLVWGFQPSHDVAYLERLGVGGTEQVLQAAYAAGVRHVVHQSSIGAYAPRRTDSPVDESWPTTGIRSSPYSRHKVAAERVLDRFLEGRTDLAVARLRPGIIGQRSAGSSMLRYFLPGLVPASALKAVPVLPLDRRLEIPMVHADDVADAVARVVSTTAEGAFNLASGPPVTVEDIAAALGARHLQVPAPVVRAAVSLSWHARLQQVDPGWVDLAYQVPLLDASRASSELGWQPLHDPLSTLGEVVAGMAAADADDTEAMRPRSLRDNVRRTLSHGPVARRRRA